jgi:hypothetical protein
MTNRTYAQCGLRIRSELELELPEVVGDAHDIDVLRGTDLDEADDGPPPGDEVASLANETGWWYRATRVTDGYRIRFQRTGEFALSSDLSRVEVRAHPGGDAALLPVLASATMSAFLLSLRGATTLHASAVAVDGRALVFVGESGQGKSTLAALMCGAGAGLITDDLLVVSGGPAPTCIGSARELRLRERAVELADGQPDEDKRETVDGRLALSFHRAGEHPFPIGAVVVPSPDREATTVDAHRLTATEALFAVLAFPRIHGWRLNDVLARDFAVASDLARQIPVYRVTIPWGPPFDPAVAPALAALAIGS